MILNYSQLAADALDSEPGARADVEQIEHAAERASALTRQLLIFSRGEVPHREVVDVAAVLRRSEEMLRRVLGGTAVLEARIDDDLWSIEADPAQLEQVIVNLAVNARDAMPDGGRLVIDARNIALDDTALAGRGELAPGPYVRITVADTGTGMSAEVIRARVRAVLHDQAARRRDRARTLDRLRDRDQARRRDPDLLRAGIRHHGEDRPARDRPCRRATSVPEIASHVTGTGRELVLLVEDEAALRRVTERILSAAGYRVISATDGSDALRLAGAHEPVDLLMTDVVMPEMMGPELARRMHDAEP